MLPSETRAPRILKDQCDARSLGITGVPLMRLRRADEPLQGGCVLASAQPWPMVACAVEQMQIARR